VVVLPILLPRAAGFFASHAIAVAAQPANPSLYSGPLPRPGPDILYAAPARAAQLTNTGIWSAPPILVSGASAYRAGEYLYQDFLYDDHGANGGARDPNDKRLNGDAFSEPNGTYTYPSDPRYAGNAADLVELRLRPLANETAFRVTFNTMVDSTLAAATIALGSPGSPITAFPHGANARAQADAFVTLHGASAEFLSALSGAVPVPLTSRLDVGRRQITVYVPHQLWVPWRGMARISAGTGLWDTSTPDGPSGRYLVPRQVSDSSHPGGLGVLSPLTASAFFNLAFRFAEPFGASGGVGGTPAWWRDAAQGAALRTGDLTPFHDDIDFVKLASGVSDDSGVPRTGPLDRILASQFETEQGTDYTTVCGGNQGCKGELRGRLQPYSLYVPAQAAPVHGYGLTLLLHSLAANYNQYFGTRNQSQFGDRGSGSLVLTPEGRGPDGWYVEYAGADTFEAWAEVAARYLLDPNRTDIAGYSMGGYGTFRFGTLYPDLFARGQPTVGPPGVGIWAPPAEVQPGGRASNTYYQLESLRNLPMMMWVASADDLVPISGTQLQARRFDALGWRYEFWTYAPAEHLTLAINDQFQPAADYLGSATVDTNPPHVSYALNPKMSFSDVGLVADHAYWLGGLALRDSSGPAPLGLIDVRSEGFGVGDAAASGTQAGAGTLTGGTLGALAYTRQYQAWGSPPAAPVADRLDLKASNLSRVVIAVARAHLDCNVTLNVTTDGPLQVVLGGCGRTLNFG